MFLDTTDTGTLGASFARPFRLLARCNTGKLPQPVLPRGKPQETGLGSEQLGTPLVPAWLVVNCAAAWRQTGRGSMGPLCAQHGRVGASVTGTRHPSLLGMKAAMTMFVLVFIIT